MGCCDDQPTAFVQLRICPETTCRKDGVGGMVALIRAGDRASDETIIARRAVCRTCPDRMMRGNRHLCKRTRQALHWMTAVGSERCEKWTQGKHTQITVSARHT
jgi:hypothetical protein